MSAFSVAAARLFADPNIGRDGWYWDAVSGQYDAIRLVLRRPDHVTSFGDTRILSETTRVDVLVSEVERPESGDRIRLDDELFEIQGEPQRDRERTIWTLDLVPV